MTIKTLSAAAVLGFVGFCVPPTAQAQVRDDSARAETRVDRDRLRAPAAEAKTADCCPGPCCPGPCCAGHHANKS